jgi:hypothetical protein
VEGIVEAARARYFLRMAFLIVGKILDSVPGVKKDGNTYNIAEEVDATLFVALGQEVMQLPRIAKVEIGSDAVRLATHKGELFYFPPEHVVGIKLGSPEKANKHSAGFGK